MRQIKEEIGDVAGAIWRALQDTEKAALSSLPKMIKQKEAITYQAVGWLAREDKIDYEVEGRKTYVVLNPTERRE